LLNALPTSLKAATPPSSIPLSACRRRSADGEPGVLPDFNNNPTRPANQRLLLNTGKTALFEGQNRAKNGQNSVRF
jgi:hypothetical protein